MDVTQRRRKPAFEAESEAYTFFQRGTELLAAGHPAQAALLLSKALRREPARNSIREALGRAEFALGRHATAARLFAERVEDVWKESLIPLYVVKERDRKYDEAEFRADRQKSNERERAERR